ncbi:ABC transporter substrate-binding protein [Planosporangium mesophilum]|uniref:Sugar-binding protein n=1 Tax=Planosporangium mesophilum TaxID=689768 RepID=A0A8J3TMK0_9ACTN|nr:extracellular solute-binding protein [Planosporangium mesophilum]GII24060.1 sugar-binding protein [Planosporangium mesophilum]
MVAAIGLSGAAACSGDKNGGGSGSDSSVLLDKNAKVSISVDCQPPTTKPAQRKQWLDDIAAFNKIHPNVTITSKDASPCEQPAAFAAQLKAGTQTDLFYAYFTDLGAVLDAGQAADITRYVTPETVSTRNDIDPSVLDTFTADGKLYGLPRNNYKMGLIYNRKLFGQAGLDPDKPPTTWDEVAAAARKISALGNGINGYGEYSAANTGGWHFTAELYGLGGRMVTADGKKAAFNDANGKQLLRNLHTMRWVDRTMGETQGYKWPDLMTTMVAGKEGMYVGAPDDITYMVETLKGDYADYGMGPMPGGKGALLGGDGYFFKKSLTPDQIKAGIAWLDFKFLTPGKGQFEYARNKADGLPVGLPEPFFFTGASAQKESQNKATYATIPVANFTAYVSTQVPGLVEPPHAQEIYKVLDTTVSAVLTDKNANIDELLKTAETQVNQVLANA